MTAFVAGTQFFVSGEKVIACPPPTTPPATGNILYSLNGGKKFYTVLGQAGSSEKIGSRHSRYNFYFDIPELSLIAAKLEYSGNTVVWGDVTYRLDESFVPAAGTTIIGLKPVMEVLTLVSTDRGYIVQARNSVDGEIRTYLNGRPVRVTPGSVHTRDIVATLFLSGGHQLIISGDYLDLSRQTATFDDRPAQVLAPRNYKLDFADDLKTVSVRKR